MDKYPISFRFGERYRFSLRHPLRFLNGEKHQGVDFATPLGTSVVSPESCDVAFTNTDASASSYGKYVVLLSYDGKHRFLYAHLRRVFVTYGDDVGKDTTIGETGNTGSSTGPHLHFKYSEFNGKTYIRKNPLKYLHQKTDGQELNVRKLFREVWKRKPARGEELYFIKRVGNKSIKNTKKDLKDKMRYWNSIVYPNGFYSPTGDLRWQYEKAKVLLGNG